MSKQNILSWFQQNESRFTDMAQKIWDNPQIAYEETYAATLQQKELQKEGFTITSSIADIPTAFMAEFGSGRPIIGILGEYDALPGLSQKVSATKEEVIPGGPGHGCGHNLLGTAGVESVIALKEVMKKKNIKGTIRYYGCPAEEVLSGKTFMAREGVFDDLDCALSWHPGKSNLVSNGSLQALLSVEYHFTGIPAHAGAAPHAGRSALDAVEQMNASANYLREHVLDGFRIHYVITNGGVAPNIVPEHASVWYYLRASTREHLEDLHRRLDLIAEGAAKMTETKVTSEIKANVYHTLPNRILNEKMYENMKRCGQITFNEEEEQFAKEIVDTVDQNIVKIDQELISSTDLLSGENLYLPDTEGETIQASTDISDVSWITPLGTVNTTCAPVGVQLHSWQATACFGTSIGHKGMHHAAKTMALTGYDLLLDPDVLEKAKAEFQQKTENAPYVCGIPEDVKPPVQQKEKTEV